MALHRKSILAILFVLLVNCAFAQYPGMAAYRAQQTRQLAQDRMLAQMNTMNYLDRNYNPSYTFVVIMKDSSKLVLDSQILNDTTLKKNYLLLVDKKFKRSDTNRYKKIYPSQTMSISRDISASFPSPQEDDTGGPKPFYLVGKASDSCWVFKVINGPISAYSSLSELSGDYLFKPFAIVAIQLNDGPIIKYNEDNLKQMVGQDLAALEDIQKKNYYKAIKKYNKDIEKAAKKK
jgi:hypothetical protein